MEKECLRCGTFFMAKTNHRKYCDKCQKNGKKIEYQQEKNLLRNKLLYDEYIPKEKICKYCHKNFIRSSAANKNDYCCRECENQYRIENAKCTYCGELLYPDIIVERYGLYLHDECKPLYYEKRAREKGLYHTCPICKKEFKKTSKYQDYCSKICYEKTIKEYEIYGIDCKCMVCKKIFKEPSNTKVGQHLEKGFCSKECKQKYIIYQNNKKIEKNNIANQKRIEKLKKERLKENETNGLCGYCKVSYKDCPYISSNYKIKPKDAKYKNSKIIECPLFKDSRKQIL